MNSWTSSGAGGHPWVERQRDQVRFGVQGWPAAGTSWDRIAAYVQLIEDLGYDSFWLPDHPAFFPDCWTTLAALAGSTRSIRLGTLATCAMFRHPLMLARLAADVDRLSGGRIVLGLGAGDYERDFQQMGLEFGSVADRFHAVEEAVQIVRGVWSNDTFSFRGRYFTVHDAALEPPPVQQPFVPLLIAGGGERITLRLVAQHADMSNFGPNINTGSAWTPLDVRRKIEVLDEHCTRLGRDASTILRSHWSPPIFLSGDRQSARQKAGRLTDFQRDLYRESIFMDTPGEAVVHFQGLVDAGMRYFIVNPLGDEETLHLLAGQVAPRLDSGVGLSSAKSRQDRSGGVSWTRPGAPEVGGGSSGQVSY